MLTPFVPNKVILYGLEDHLKYCAEIDDSYKHLLGRWITDKDEYSECLKAASISNPGYSMHDASHSERIVSAIEKILGEERISVLSPTDTWLMLECAYSHDVGMAVAVDDLIKDWFSDRKFDDWVEKEVLTDRALSEQYDFIFPLLQRLREEKGESLNGKRDAQIVHRYTLQDENQIMAIYEDKESGWPIKFRNAINSLAQAYKRKDHADRSRQMVMGLIGGDSVIPQRLKTLIIAVNEFHGGKRENLLKDFSKTTKGIGNDDAHPRLIAIMIRIGDLLDLDSDRFNKYIISVTGNIDRYSIIHQIKHNGVVEFGIQPSCITVKAEYSKNKTEDYINTLPKSTAKYKPEEITAEAVKAMLEWLNWLDEETKFLKIHQNSILPNNLQGPMPSFKKEVTYEEAAANPDEVRLVYESDPRRSAELIEGIDMYRRPGLVFLRELIQNAIDTSKRQLFRDIQVGLYNHTVEYADIDEKPEKRCCCSHADRKIKSPLDLLLKLGTAIWGYRVEIYVRENPPGTCSKSKCCKQEERIEITVRDHGTGISMDNLRNMRHIGNIFDKDLNEMRPHMPKWLRPTGSFGFGMQSVFRNVKEFEITTVCMTSNQKLEGLRARFYSSRMGGEIYPQSLTEKEASRFGRGTAVTITLSKSDAELFLQSAYRSSQNRFGGYDVFSPVLELTEQLTEKYIEYICAFNGFPILFNPDLLRINADISHNLRELFGEYVIMRDDDGGLKIIKIPGIKNTGAAFNETERISGLSFWDAKNEILTKYSRDVEFAEELEWEKNKLYFKGILVEDEWVRRKIALPRVCSGTEEWSISAHIMGLEANQHLTISRDGFLPSSAPGIAKMLQKNNLDFLNAILEIIKSSPQASNERTQTDTESFYKKIAEDQRFLRALADRTLHVPMDELSDIMRKVRNDIMRKKVVYIIDGRGDCEQGRLSTDTGIFPTDDVWYINDEKFLSPQAISLYDCSVKDDSIIATVDSLANYSDHLAISKLELFIPKWGEGRFEQIYTLSPRSGVAVEMNEEYFWKYAKSLFNGVLSDTGDGWRRVLLPGITRYGKLAVYNVPDALKTHENERFMSWIITPFSEKQYAEFLTTRNAAVLEDCLKIPEGKDIIRWVAKHSLMNTAESHVTESEIFTAYQQWIENFILFT